MPSPRKRGLTLRYLADKIDGYGVILEDIRAQNRTTIEAVEASRAALEEKIDRVDQESRGRDSVLEAAIRALQTAVEGNSTDIRRNSKDIRRNTRDIRKNSEDIIKNGEDIRDLATRVDALGPLEQRVSRLERQASS